MEMVLLFVLLGYMYWRGGVVKFLFYSCITCTGKDAKQDFLGGGEDLT